MTKSTGDNALDNQKICEPRWRDVAHQTRLPNDLMLNHWLNKKTSLIVFRFRFRGAEKVNKPCTFCVLRGIFVSLGNEQKIGECHAIAYGFLRLWCKYEIREFAHFVRFSFRVMKVY